MISISAVIIIFLATITSASSISITCNKQKLNYFNNEEIETCVAENLKILNNEEIVEISGTNSQIKAFKTVNSESTHLPGFFFNSFPNLEHFIFEDSKLIAINSDALKNQKNLIEISLHNNEIQEINSGIFTDHKNLKKMILSSNKISKIDVDAFKGLSELIEIYLSDNEIKELDHKTFRTNRELKVLKLDNNLLKSLPLTIFNHLLNLNTLTLDHNEIEELPGRIFNDNEKLEIFTVVENKLTQIGEENIEKFKNLKIHNFRDNPCTEGLHLGYDIDDLEEVMRDNNCYPDVEKINTWLMSEVRELRRNKREISDLDEIPEKFYTNLMEKLGNEENFVLKSHSKGLKGVEDKIEGLKTESSNFQLEFGKSYVKNSDFEFTKTNLNEKLKNLEKNQNQNEEKNSKDLTELEGKMNENLRTETQKLNGQISRDLNDNYAKKSKFDELKALLDSLSTSIIKIETENDKKLESLKSETTKMLENYVKISDFDIFKKKIEENSENPEKNSNNGEIDTKLTELERKMNDKVKSEIMNANGQLSRDLKDIYATKSEFNNIETSLGDLSTSVNQIKNEDYKGKFAKVQKYIDNLTKKLDRNEGTLKTEDKDDEKPGDADPNKNEEKKSEDGTANDDDYGEGNSLKNLKATE